MRFNHSLMNYLPRHGCLVCIIFLFSIEHIVCFSGDESVDQKEKNFLIYYLRTTSILHLMALQLCLYFHSLTGSFLTLMPLPANIPLRIAGVAGGTAVSPMPVGWSVLGKK